MPSSPQPVPRSLRLQWRALQWGAALLPLNPILALPGLLLALFGAWAFRWRQITGAPLSWGFAILSLLLILTTALAQYPLESLLGLPNFLPQFAVLLAFSQIIRRFAQLRFIAQALSAASAVLVVLGFGQMYGHWSSPGWLSALGTNLVAEGRPEGRMSSLLMYANLYSAYLLMVLPLALALFIQEWRGTELNRRRHLVLLGALILGETIALFLTESRSAWGIGLLIYIAFAVYLTWYWFVGLCGALTALVLGASFSPVGREPLRQIVPRVIWGRLSDELYPDRYRTAYRSTQWEFAWGMMKDSPLWGQGLRNFTPLYEAEMNVWLGHPHSLPLMLLGEMGIPATLLFLGLIGVVLARAVLFLGVLGKFAPASPRRANEYLWLFAYLAAFGAATFYNFFDVTLFDIRINLLGWILLAAITGVSRSRLARFGSAGHLRIDS